MFGPIQEAHSAEQATQAVPLKYSELAQAIQAPEGVRFLPGEQAIQTVGLVEHPSHEALQSWHNEPERAYVGLTQVWQSELEVHVRHPVGHSWQVFVSK